MIVLAALLAFGPLPTPTPHHYVCAADTFGWIGCAPITTPRPRTSDFCEQHHAGRFEAIIRTAASEWYVACSGADFRWDGHEWVRLYRWPH